MRIETERKREHKGTPPGKQWREKAQTHELEFWIKIIPSSQFYYNSTLHPGCPCFQKLLYEPLLMKRLKPGPRERDPAPSQEAWIDRKGKQKQESCSWGSSLTWWPLQVEISWVPGPVKVFKEPRSASEIVITDTHCPARTMLHGMAALWLWMTGLPVRTWKGTGETMC